jgi:hypothetical protein
LSSSGGAFLLPIERVVDLGLKVNCLPLVSKQQAEKYNQTEINGYYVMTHSSTQAKRNKLLEIAGALGEKVVVNVV